MLIIEDFAQAWPLIDPRRGRRSPESLASLLRSVIRIEHFPYYREGAWVSDGRRDARLDLETIWPEEMLADLQGQGLDDLVLALEHGDVEAAQRFAWAGAPDDHSATCGAGHPSLSILVARLITQGASTAR
jgi:hypothetical protein